MSVLYVIYSHAKHASVCVSGITVGNLRKTFLTRDYWLRLTRGKRFLPLDEQVSVWERRPLFSMCKQYGLQRLGGCKWGSIHRPFRSCRRVQAHEVLCRLTENQTSLTFLTVNIFSRTSFLCQRFGFTVYDESVWKDFDYKEKRNHVLTPTSYCLLFIFSEEYLSKYGSGLSFSLSLWDFFSCLIIGQGKKHKSDHLK